MQRGLAARGERLPDAERKEGAFRQQWNELENAVQVLNKALSGKPGAIQFGQSNQAQIWERA